MFSLLTLAMWSALPPPNGGSNMLQKLTQSQDAFHGDRAKDYQNISKQMDGISDILEMLVNRIMDANNAAPTYLTSDPDGGARPRRNRVVRE